MSLAISIRRRNISRVIFLLAVGFVVRVVFLSDSPTFTPYSPDIHEIRQHNVLERVTRADKGLNVQKHKFLQVRMGRDERDDLFMSYIRNGAQDYWDRFQKP
jgi:hypothetical protein